MGKQSRRKRESKESAEFRRLMAQEEVHLYWAQCNDGTRVQFGLIQGEIWIWKDDWSDRQFHEAQKENAGKPVETDCGPKRLVKLSWIINKHHVVKESGMVHDQCVDRSLEIYQILQNHLPHVAQLINNGPKGRMVAFKHEL